jgi:NADH dehydrogenase FAD-containing subunit
MLDIFKIDYNNNKKNVILLGDGFFARGFLHTINRNKFNIFQIYRDSFINPQDMIYSLQRNETYDNSKIHHFRDFFYKSPDYSLQLNIAKLEIEENKIKINDNPNPYSYDYLVIGLGTQKSLKDWSDEFNSFVNKKNLNIGIVGMGPIGIELGFILSKYNKVDMFDMLPESKILAFANKQNKDYILNLLDKKNITKTYGEMYDKNKYTHDTAIFCVGARANSLTSNFKINKYLQHANYLNVYIGGDCINSMDYIKTAQMAYQQGIYVAKKLNGDIEETKEFEYKSNGYALNIGDNKILVEKHKYLTNGIYPDILIKLYSMFFI